MRAPQRALPFIKTVWSDHPSSPRPAGRPPHRAPSASPILMLLAVLLFSPAARADEPPTPLSTIDIPVMISISPLGKTIEGQVPKGVNNLDGYEVDSSGGYGARYSVERGAISITMRGPILSVSTPVQYGFEACRRTRQKIFTGGFTMWPCVSCGLGDEVRRQVQLSLRSQVMIRSDWRIVTRTSPRTPLFRNRCAVTALNLDVTDWKIAPWIEQQMTWLARSVDANVPRMSDLRKNAELIWRELQNPVELSPRMWLILQPEGARVAPLDGRGNYFVTTIGLLARPRLVAGGRPSPAGHLFPNAEVGPAAASQGLTVPFEVVLPFAEASALLSREMVGTRRVGDREITIQSVRVSEGSDGDLRLTLAVRFRHALLRTFQGDVELRGTPVYNAATGALELQNLDYTLDPKSKRALFRISDALYHDVLRTQLAQSARWPLKPRLEQLTAQIDRALRRPLGPGARLNGTVTRLVPSLVRVSPDGITLQASVSGSAVIIVMDWSRELRGMQ